MIKPAERPQLLAPLSENDAKFVKEQTAHTHRDVQGRGREMRERGREGDLARRGRGLATNGDSRRNKEKHSRRNSRRGENSFKL